MLTNLLGSRAAGGRCWASRQRSEGRWGGNRVLRNSTAWPLAEKDTQIRDID